MHFHSEKIETQLKMSKFPRPIIIQGMHAFFDIETDNPSDRYLFLRSDYGQRYFEHVFLVV